MLRNLLTSFILPGIIVGVLAFNYQRLMDYAQTVMLKNEAQQAIKAGRWDKAVILYEQAWKAHPQVPDIGIKLAWLYQKNRQIKEAEGQYRNLVLRFPTNLTARLGLIQVLKTQPDRINEAIDQAKIALLRNKDSITLLNTVGDLYNDRAQMPEENRESVREWLSKQAVYYYQRSLEKNPKQFDPIFHTGVAYHGMKNWEAAANAYCDALLIKPDHYQARYNLGMALSMLNFPDAGFRQLDRASAILSEEGRMDMAMKVAMNVQTVKNSIYESREKPKSDLGGSKIPPFLKHPECLKLPLIKGEPISTSEK
jgi:tetratricopeptide (TPR) repeat protein